MDHQEQTIYTTGGTVQAGGGIYLSRKADDELLQLCREGQFAYVLTPRQMGKSSLMVETAKRLDRQGIISIIIDLTKIGTEVTAEQWYLGILTEIVETLEFKTDIFEWWEQHNKLGVTQRLTKFFEEVLLQEVNGRIAVFVDEIDTTLSLGFTDDFFIAIRYFYVARAKNKRFGRLSFVLIGVASPGDLIQDSQRTPFNIGKRINLTNFTITEAKPLIQGLSANNAQAKELLQWILHWTKGHPYLTQRLCESIVEKGQVIWDEKNVKHLVEDLFFTGGERNDNNLLFVRDMLTQRTPNGNNSLWDILTTYREVWREKKPILDEERSLVKSHLKLSGIVRKNDETGMLHVSNLIYKNVFNNTWIKEHLPINWIKRLQRARATILALAAITAVSIPLSIYAVAQQHRAEAQTVLAKSNESKAFLLAEQTLEAFIAAVISGQIVKKQRNWQSNEYLKMPAVTALQQAVYPDLLQSPYKFRERNRLEGHQSSINNISFSPDSSIIASASSDGTIKLWNVQGDEVTTLIGHQGSIYSVSFSPDGNTIASASGDSTIKLWDRQGNELKTLAGHQGPVHSVSFSPEGNTIASASDDTTIKLWDRQGNELKTLTGHQSRITGVSFSPDGKIIGSTSTDYTAQLWDRQGNELTIFSGHQTSVMDLSFSPDSKTVASAGADNTVKLWDLEGNELATLSGHQSAVWGVSFSPDGNTIASASTDDTVKLWDLEGNELATLSGHQNSVNGVSFSPDGNIIASASSDTTVKIWARQENDFLKFVPLSESDIHVNSFSHDGDIIATANENYSFTLWERQGNQLAIHNGHQGPVINITFSPDNNTIASASRDGTLKLWNQNGDEFASFSGHQDKVYSFFERIKDIRNTIQTEGFKSKDYVHIMTSLIYGSGHRSVATSISFSPDGKTIASASFDKTIKLWDRRGKQLAAFDGHKDFVTSISFSPDGKTIASASFDKTIKLWDRQGKQLATFDGHKDWVFAISFSPDGNTLASASEDGTVKLWDLQGKEIETFQGHKGRVFDISFSPDGNTLASASEDGTVKLWDLQGNLLASLSAHQGSVNNVTFSTDRSTLASIGDDGTIKLWDRNLDSLLEHSCDWLSGYLRNNPKGQRSANEGVCEGYL